MGVIHRMCKLFGADCAVNRVRVNWHEHSDHPPISVNILDIPMAESLKLFIIKNFQGVIQWLPLLNQAFIHLRAQTLV